MHWTTRAPLLIVAVALLPAGIASELVDDAPSWIVWVALGAAALALGWSAVLWVTRKEVRARLAPGIGAAVLVLVMAAVGMARGSAEASVHDAQTALAKAGVDDYGGWVGQTTRAGVVYFAAQLDPGSPIGQQILATFRHSMVPLVIGVDNRHGATPVELDVVEARLELADHTQQPTLPRGEVLDTAVGGREQANKLHGGHYTVPAGGRLGNGIVFLDPRVVVNEFIGVTILANGRTLTIPGRYYTAEEKAALRDRKR